MPSSLARPHPADTEASDWTPEPPTLRARRLRPIPAPAPTLPPAVRPRRQWSPGRPLRFLLLGMLLFVVLWFFWSQMVMPGWQRLCDQWQYGDSHVSELDADVGHGGVSTFLAEDRQDRIVIVELLLSQPGVVHVYVLSGLAEQGSPPVVQLGLQRDPSTGRLDLVIQVEGSGVEIVLHNTGTGFEEA